MHPSHLLRQSSVYFRTTLTKNFCVLACVIGGLVAATQANAGVLYGSTAAGVSGELYILNLTNNGSVHVGELIGPGGTNYPATGLAFHPVTGVLYGSTAHSDPNIRSRLVTIDPQTALVTVIGPFNVGNSGTPATMSDIAFDNNGNLFGISTADGAHLCSINLTNGKATYVGPAAFSSTVGGGIAISTNSVIYSTPTHTSSATTNYSTFGTFNATNGAFTFIANINNPANSNYSAIAALAFDDDGMLYGINLGSGVFRPTRLFKINPATGSAQELTTSRGAIDAIAFQPTLTPTLAPTLGISRPANKQAVLNWPASPSGFQLEYRTAFATGAWLTNTTPPTTSNGTNFLSLSATNPSTFFRLHKP